MIYTYLAEGTTSAERDEIDRRLGDYGRDPAEVRRERWGLEPADITEQNALLELAGGVLA